MHYAKHLDYALFNRVMEDIAVIVKQSVLDFMKDFIIGKEDKEVLFKLQIDLIVIQVEEVHNEISNLFSEEL